MTIPSYRCALRTLFTLLMAAACTACNPASTTPQSSKPTVPQIPEVADPGLQQQLRTLHAMATEYARLSAKDAKPSEKSTQRLGLLKQGIANFEKECRANLDAAGQQQDAVKEFLRQCISASTSR